MLYFNALFRIANPFVVNPYSFNQNYKIIVNNNSLFNSDYSVLWHVLRTLNINSLNSYNIPCFCPSFYRYRNGGTERLSHFPKVTLLGMVEPGYEF